VRKRMGKGKKEKKGKESNRVGRPGSVTPPFRMPPKVGGKKGKKRRKGGRAAEPQSKKKRYHPSQSIMNKKRKEKKKGMSRSLS